MFLSKSDEETTSNRKLAKDLVDKWVKFLTHFCICGIPPYYWPSLYGEGYRIFWEVYLTGSAYVKKCLPSFSDASWD